MNKKRLLKLLSLVMLLNALYSEGYAWGIGDVFSACTGAFSECFKRVRKRICGESAKEKHQRLEKQRRNAAERYERPTQKRGLQAFRLRERRRSRTLSTRSDQPQGPDVVEAGTAREEVSRAAAESQNQKEIRLVNERRERLKIARLRIQGEERKGVDLGGQKRRDAMRKVAIEYQLSSKDKMFVGLMYRLLLAESKAAASIFKEKLDIFSEENDLDMTIGSLLKALLVELQKLSKEVKDNKEMTKLFKRALHRLEMMGLFGSLERYLGPVYLNDFMLAVDGEQMPIREAMNRVATSISLKRELIKFMKAAKLSKGQIRILKMKLYSDHTVLSKLIEMLRSLPEAERNQLLEGLFNDDSLMGELAQLLDGISDLEEKDEVSEEEDIYLDLEEVARSLEGDRLQELVDNSSGQLFDPVRRAFLLGEYFRQLLEGAGIEVTEEHEAIINFYRMNCDVVKELLHDIRVREHRGNIDEGYLRQFLEEQAREMMEEPQAPADFEVPVEIAMRDLVADLIEGAIVRSSASGLFSH